MHTEEGVDVDMQRGMSRRNFFKLGGAAALGAAGTAALTGCSPQQASDGVDAAEATQSQNGWSWETAPEPIDDSAIVETVEKDFIVVGAGLAGVSTACSIAENGGEVVVIEKNATYSWRGAHYGSINNRRWREQGVEVDPTDVTRDWIAQCNSRCNERLVWTFLNRSGEALDWLSDKVEAHGGVVDLLGCCYQNPTYKNITDPLFILKVRFFHQTRRAAPTNEEIGNFEMAIYSLYNDAVDAGAEFSWNAKAAQLVKEDNRVTAVIAETEEGYKKFVGRKGVIMCTGDISGNDEMCEAYSPLMLRCEQTQYVPVGANMGEGQQMGMWIGAKMEETPFSPMIHPQGYLQLSQWFLSVNTLGNRFMNEDTWGQGKSLGVLTTPGNADHAWCIFDSEWQNQIPETLDIGGGMFWVGPDHLYGQEYSPGFNQGQFDTGVENGMVKQGDTFEELADAIAADEPSFDKEVFLAEVERYNELCRAGKDTDFGKREQLLYEIKNPPYYAAKYGPCRMVCPGDMLINTNSQVLGEDDKPIEGLYAVGNCSGGLYAVDYPLVVLGDSHGRCVTFGYLLGRQLMGVE